MGKIALETKRLTLKPFEEKDAYIAAYNSRQPSIANAMSDMILADEKAGLKWINWINSMASIKTPWQVLSIKLKSDNIPSNKVVEKLGFEFIETREIDYDNKPTLFKYYKLLKFAEGDA
jgi:RimJ/RimL family protein N-acetyltransferase